MASKTKDTASLGTSQDRVLLENLMEFYQNEDYFNKLISIVDGKSKTSLRLVDWFATNFAKKHFTVVTKQDNTRVKVYKDYKLHLRAYSKKRFDPFCRWARLTIPYGNDGQAIQTTVGQLNFFKWAILNDIITYIEENRSTIEADMNSRNSTSKRQVSTASGQRTRKKREELSVSASRSVKHESVEVRVSFD